MVQAERWRSHRVLGTILSSAAVAAPFAVSIVAAMAVGRQLPRGEALFRQALWWVAVLASSTVAFVGSERLCRRLLPLAALLKMTMLFPDHAPKRLKVAWRAGTTRELERRTSEGNQVPTKRCRPPWLRKSSRLLPRSAATIERPVGTLSASGPLRT